MKSNQKKNTKNARTSGFGSSLDQYMVDRVVGVPWKWEWVGVAASGIAILLSLATGYLNSPTLGADESEIILTAGERGDYELARELYEHKSSDVLGVSSDPPDGEAGLEELVYPERRLMREIENREKLLVKYPGSRDILLTIASLYEQAGNDEKSDEYYEMARVLDPNGEKASLFLFP